MRTHPSTSNYKDKKNNPQQQKKKTEHSSSTRETSFEDGMKSLRLIDLYKNNLTD